MTFANTSFRSPGKLVTLCLAMVTLAAFWPVRNCEFVNLDDHRYVTRNPDVQAGLSRASAWWALTTTFNANWHPLTWLSLQLDYQIYRLNPAGYHVTNLLWHTANVLLLFAALRRLTGRLWPSAAVAALFALHPLHVESVAWVSERKDVLSTFFWMLTLLAYAWYVERPGNGRYLCVFAALVPGLMAKPMLVTLPCVLLLLDYWPLQRVAPASDNGAADVKQKSSGRSWRFLALEKLPLFLLAAGSCVLTLHAQSAGGAVRSLSDVPLAERLANAVLAYGRYLALTVWSHDLGVLYPRDELGWTDRRVAGALALLVAISLLTLWQRRRRPYLLVGWLWFVGTLVPVIGLVQVGDQALADRYTYVPLVGLFIMAAWAGAELAAQGPVLRRMVALATAAALVVCALGTLVQLGYWHDSIALWEHTLRVTGPNAQARHGLGIAYRDAGRLDEAVEQFKEALRIEPTYDRCDIQLFAILGKQGKIEEAVSHFKSALRFRPDNAHAQLEVAIFLIRQGHAAAAIPYLNEAARLDPQLKDSALFQEAERAAAMPAPRR
ncbi:MAG TPA: tetratricopeptide repeat protein [Gemmataceae bacterium]|nr:tetratricopeptide repeat protein [Gemmataceae bacterium]